jgi:hypothetical protein
MKDAAEREFQMNFRDFNRPVRGIFELDVINVKDGAIVNHIREDNLIVNGARVQMSKLIAGDWEDCEIAKVAFGTNGTPPKASDEEITDAFEKEVTGHTYPEEGQVKFSWYLAASEDNGQAIMEFGLLCADGTLFARRTREKPLNKEEDIAFKGTWTIIY